MTSVRSLRRLVCFALVTFCSAAHAAESEPLTNGDYYAKRDELRDKRLTELQRKKLCDSLVGEPVSFYSWVADVASSGTVRADMDDSLLSVAEITLTHVPERVAVELRKGQRVNYTGTISSCTADTMSIYLEIAADRVR